MEKSWLPEGGENLFQAIKRKCAEAEAWGQPLYRLSIGQPTGPALLSARKAAALAVLSEEESMHEYQDNGSPGVPGFAQKFVQLHLRSNLDALKDIDLLPIPGIKPMLGLIPLACGAATERLSVATTTKPGYPTPADWCGNYLSLRHHSLPLNPENAFLFNPEEIEIGTKLVMTNYPHNPSGQIGTREWWEKLCRYCKKRSIRIFNDGAYSALAHLPESSTLTDVAIRFPGLSWAEAFSASKLIGNGTGWRIGAIVGSVDFVADIKTIKGNTDSGFVAPMAAGVLAAIESDLLGITECREKYAHRLKILIEILSSHGMRLAVEPRAGFFTLWKVPQKAFGEEIKDAEQFNFMMIERTGVVGVHFHPYIRYAVCGDVEKIADVIRAAFKRAKVSYD